MKAKVRVKCNSKRPIWKIKQSGSWLPEQLAWTQQCIKIETIDIRSERASTNFKETAIIFLLSAIRFKVPFKSLYCDSKVINHLILKLIKIKKRLKNQFTKTIFMMKFRMLHFLFLTWGAVHISYDTNYAPFGPPTLR